MVGNRKNKNLKVAVISMAVLFVLVIVVMGPIEAWVDDLSYIGRYPLAVRYGLEVLAFAIVCSVAGYFGVRAATRRRGR